MGDSREPVEERTLSLSASAAKRVAWLLEQEAQPGLMLRAICATSMEWVKRVR